ncbi:TPA: hypothetical protein ACX6TX_004323 [Yersinia enterocolitica]|uniref:hypothetical protein n=1 Tax=Yersinia enterocolitica TaxID=630 RepID=UPI0005DB4B35|nr:hypothetical protein [Yersinia enterocolitica]EKN4024279.1 hypothetical protein [Yersinia enterocolitica]EKN4025422.1 hypothetical protein [Yersinia enterocolitica]EKN6118323.1 hypothetical protein [Yersinia enterocolitica]UYK19933.1 hypothetical protein N4220_06085 [Yersinia enterocolitica]CQH49918.1 Uncharacterised protein [Yersinia enterocolitica]
MKKILLCALALLPLAAHALTVTLILQDVIEAADGKICVYGDHLRTETIKIHNGQCSHTKIFTID